MQQMKKINWKDIPGYNGRYQASDCGKIRSILREPYTVLKPHQNKNGYACVTIRCSKQNKKTIEIHRLTAKTFLRKRRNKRYVNHKDGNKQNNNIFNLEYTTQSENIKHAVETGLFEPHFKKVKRIKKEFA